MEYKALSFDDGCRFFRDVEFHALLAMLHKIAPKVCAEDCPPLLAVGKKYTQEASFESAWITIHLYPALCTDNASATAWIRGYEGGMVFDTASVRERYYQCMPLRGVCRNFHRLDNGELICDKGHKCPAHGCADMDC